MPKRVDKTAQRHMITNATIKVIAASGIEGAKLREVARYANVTTGTVMHYFKSKDDVLEATLEEIVCRTITQMQKTSNPTTIGDVNIFIRRTCKYLPLDEASRSEWRVWLAFWGKAIASKRLRDVHRRHYNEIVDHMVLPLQSLILKGSKPSLENTFKCADAMIAAIDGVGTRATLEPASWPRSRQIETLSQLLLPLLNDFKVGAESALTTIPTNKEE